MVACAAAEHLMLMLSVIAAGPFISYLNLSDIEMHTVNTTNATEAAAVSAASKQPSWDQVGGYSLHEQQDLWGQKATGRNRRL